MGSLFSSPIGDTSNKEFNPTPVTQKSVVTLPNTVPFINPPATYDGKPVPKTDWSYFCTYAQAKEQMSRIHDAIIKAGYSISDGISVYDGTTSEIVLTNPIDDQNIQDTNIAEFYCEGHFDVKNADGTNTNYLVSEWAGNLIYRGMFPSQVDMKPNGIGGPNLYIELLDFGLAEAYLNA